MAGGGWVGAPGVPLSLLKTFKRMQALTTDEEVVAEALLLSAGLLEVSDDRKNVRRCTPLPDSLTTDQCSIYAVRLVADRQMVVP
jgi:hypothetical protein